MAQSGRSSSSNQQFASRGGRSGGRGRGRRSPHFQLCRQNGHYADKCPDLSTFAQRGSSMDANLAQAFHAKCNVYDNPSDWYEADQRALLILQASLTEEAMAEVIGLSTAHDVWCALESAYSHDSVERMQNLRDSLRQLQKGTSSVSEYGRKFKGICDQLAAIGHPVDDVDKNHWFLCGLGPSFETFSTALRTVKPRPTFRDLLS
ncbi:zinc finger, CCHC-type, Gag-polypeptide of LTR copia-type [Artemisia annua]|uniref:Zinc finger, CCHC-type, Gag-polypeptide of LTR copia-type n=1 Tax=Artemisia annua TaxID=35608 RepID=A0A2U1PFA9_ARTAN|nr:zinc finger, CCHC-type, Gag-polypeptide of LTR copia-type [Artemisia annua]